MSRGPEPDGLLESVLAHALELRDSGNEDWLQQAVRDCPEHLDAVREAVAATDLMPRVFSDALEAGEGLGRMIAGRFRLSERIGSGAMGVVYLAEDLELVRTVAVKVLRAGLMDPDESGRRFEREAEAMASVQHGSIITVYDRGHTTEGEPYIVMEWIDGVPLDEVIRTAADLEVSERVHETAWLSSRLDIAARGESSYLRTAVRWTADLAAGLETVHGAGVLHRDVKPSNILVRKDGQPVLLDFGLALLEGDSTLTRTASSIGTPAYMPPEALVPGCQRSSDGDIYSLTASLYHMLTLQPPYLGSPSEVLAGIATVEPVPAARLRPGLPRDLQAILDKGMNRKPKGRYASAAELEADLRAFLTFLPIQARPVSPIRRWSRRVLRSNLARGAALALLLVAAVSSAFFGYRMVDARARAGAFEVERRLPGNFSTSGVRYRRFRYEEDQEQLRQQLNAAVATGYRPIKMLNLRASFRLDHDDPVGAAEDMTALANHVGTPYAQELARRYGLVDPDASGALAVDLEGMPDAVSEADLYLEAYHLIRSGEEGAGHEALCEDNVQEILHAEELRLTTIPFSQELKSEERYERALDVYRQGLALEERLGGRTVATVHVLGRMLIIMKRYSEAAELLDEGIELNGSYFPMLTNAGLAKMAVNRLDEAREHLERAVDLRPNFYLPLENLTHVLIRQGEYDEAIRRVGEADFGASQAAQSFVLRRQSMVETYRALAHRGRGELTQYKASLNQASEYAEQANGLYETEAGLDQRMLNGLLDDDLAGAFLEIASIVASDPYDHWAMEGFLAVMPEDLDAASTAAARSVFEAMNRRPSSRSK